MIDFRQAPAPVAEHRHGRIAPIELAASDGADVARVRLHGDERRVYLALWLHDAMYRGDGSFTIDHTVTHAILQFELPLWHHRTVDLKGGDLHVAGQILIPRTTDASSGHLTIRRPDGCFVRHLGLHAPRTA